MTSMLLRQHNMKTAHNNHENYQQSMITEVKPTSTALLKFKYHQDRNVKSKQGLKPESGQS